MVGSLRRVRVVLTHEDCWSSQFPEAHGVTLSLSLRPDKDILRTMILFYRKPDMEAFKRGKGVRRMHNVSQTGSGAVLDFTNDYSGSVAGYLHDSGVFILGNEVRGGREVWTFLTYRNKVRETLSGLSSIAKTESVLVEPFNPSVPRLTAVEDRVLQTAIEGGFFEYPRRVDAGTLANMLGMNKVTLLYHLRKAQRKVMESYLKSRIL